MRRAIDLFLNMTSIDKLIIQCVRDDEHSTKLAGISELLNGDMNWDELIGKATTHGVNAFVYHALKDIAPGKVPEDVLQKIKSYYLMRLAFGMVLSAELSDLIKEFSDKNIKMLPLKGSYLDQAIYVQPGFREYNDIDILVNKHDVPSAAAILDALGYRKMDENEKLLESEGRTQVHYRKANSTLVDLHWEAMNNKWYPSVSRYLEDNIWQNARLVKFDGNVVLSLASEDLLIYQCIHLSVHHNFSSLIWFKDIDQIVRFSKDLDWESVASKIKGYRLSAYCYYALYITKQLFDSPVPGWVLDRLQPRFLSARIFEYFLQRENLMEISEDRRGKAQQAWMLIRDSFWERLKVIRWRNLQSIQWYLHYYPFLPKVKEIYYYPFYPLLILLRLVRRPSDQLSARVEG